jgi:ceramide glucosyltransferase
LESTFTQEYPNFEILLSVADENDQALPVARELMAKYPDVNSRIIIGWFCLLGRWERSDS